MREYRQAIRNGHLLAWSNLRICPVDPFMVRFGSIGGNMWLDETLRMWDERGWASLETISRLMVIAAAFGDGMCMAGLPPMGTIASRVP